MEDSFKHFQPKKSLDKLEKSLAGVDLKVGRKNKSPEEMQGEAMEAFIERNAEKEGMRKESVVEEKLDSQGEAMEAFIKNESSDKKSVEISVKTEGSEDEAEERAENTPDKNEEVVFEEVVEGEPGKRRSLEDIPVKEDGSYKEEKWPGSIRIKEKMGELEELQSAVERARMGYASKDYEVTNVFARIKKIFAGNLRSTPGNHPETHNQYNAYKIALTELLDYQMAQLRESDLSPEELSAEMEKLTKYYNQDEKANLYAARTDARAVDWEKKYGKAPGWIAKYGGKYVNKYRNLDWKTKMAISAGVALSGAGLLLVGQRILGGAAAGAGITAGMEAKYRQEENMRLAEERANIKNELEKIADPEERYAALTAQMQKEMEGYQKSLKTEKSKAFQRKMLGVTAGIFIGSGALSHLIGWGHSAYDAHFGQPSPEMMPSHPTGISANGVEDKGVSAHPNVSRAPEAPSVSETPNVADARTPLGGVEVAQKGDSIWKMIGRHFVDNKEFAGLNPEQKTYVIDALKDRVAGHTANFNLSDVDKIKLGYKLDFSKLVENDADFHSIVEHAKHLNAAQLQNIGHNNEAILNWIHDNPGQALDSPQVEEILSQAQDQAPPAPENILHETVPQPSAMPNAPSYFPTYPGETVNADAIDIAPTAGVGLAAAIGGVKVINKNPAEKSNVVKFPDAAARAARAEAKNNSENAVRNTNEKFEKLAKKYKLNQAEDLMANLKSVILTISLKSLENWRVMKDVKFSELGKKGGKLSVKLEKNIKTLEKDMISLLGEKARAKPDDTLMTWLTRNAKDFLQAEKVEELERAA